MMTCLPVSSTMVELFRKKMTMSSEREDSPVTNLFYEPAGLNVMHHTYATLAILVLYTVFYVLHMLFTYLRQMS